MTEDLKAKVLKLEQELQKKDQEISGHLDKIEKLEETVERLDALVPDEEEEETKSKGKGKTKDSKAQIELEVKDKEIRELKDKMGFLRKEKIQLQQELEKIIKEQNKEQGKGSSVIRIEEKKTPLDALVNDLQAKVNKQRLMITQLKQQTMSADAAELNQKIKEKEDELEKLKGENVDLKKKASQAPAAGSDSITKGLTQDLQNQLNKTKKQLETMKQQLEKYESKGKKEKSGKVDKEFDALKENIDELKEEVSKKNAQIEDLKTKIGKGKETAPSAAAPGTAPVPGIVEDLQSKLNKSKIQIKTLQDELDKYKKEGKAPEGKAPQELEQELTMQKQMLVSLQQELETQNQTLQAKEGELGAVKGEATQHKIKCEDLENVIKLKEQKINELKAQVEGLSGQVFAPATPVEDPQLALRLREFKSILDELTKQNIQQRLELSQLRNL